MKNHDYLSFLESKRITLENSGFKIDETDFNTNLFANQKHVVKTALLKGRFAIFSAPGTGKTLMQLEWARCVNEYTKQPVLILCPLAVAGQTIQEGQKFGIEVKKYNCLDVSGICIANYEQIENIDLDAFAGVVLDESSILKNYEGATRNKIIEGFAQTPYKLACTATPSPNDPMELGNHSEFLNVMSRNEMLAMYFVHDGGDTSKWRLKGHCKQLFYDWCAQWCVMFSKPSDIGFEDDERYTLPPLNLIEKQIVTPKRDNGQLFNETNISATDFNAELRLTKLERLEQVVELVNGSTENFIVWIKQNEEGDYLRKMIPDAVEVKGSDSPEWKEEKLLGFANGAFRVLITKAKIASFGLNYQNCHNQVWASLDFSFEALFQGICRSLRFGQLFPVNIYLITTDTMVNVIQAIWKKWRQHEEMQKAMTDAVNKNIHATKKIKMQREAETIETEFATLKLGDAFQLIQTVPDESIGMTMFSPAFPELYVYSDQDEDLGNCKDYNDFVKMFGFLPPELFRVMQAGRNVVVHCMDTPIQKGKHGFIGLRDFSGMLLKAFDDAGFIYHSRVTLWKDPVTEMQRTKALGLLHKQIKKDAAMSRVGIPDYLLVFRKPGEHKNPVIHQDVDPTKPNYLPVDLWQKYASPVWMDIDYGDTLNKQEAREEKDEKHICPLQLQTIERAIHLWTNEGDTVFEPFGGIGSVPFKAVEMKRRAIAFELKKSYFDVMVKNVKSAEIAKAQLQMF